MNEETTEIDVLSILVHESISIAEAVIVGIIFERITSSITKSFDSDTSDTVVSVKEYRKLLNDYTSTDKRITERIMYLDSLCRNIIKSELQKITTKNI